MGQTIYIPDLFKDVVDKVNIALAAKNFDKTVFFDWGHYVEIERNLTSKANSPKKPLRYPLIWLVTDIEETTGKDISVYAKGVFNLFILQDTTVKRTQAERRDQVYLPVLYPIYEEFINQCALSRNFKNPFANKIERTKIDRPFFGVQDPNGNGVANLFNDYIDAVQIKSLKLDISRNVACVTNEL